MNKKKIAELEAALNAAKAKLAAITNDAALMQSIAEATAEEAFADAAVKAAEAERTAACEAAERRAGLIRSSGWSTVIGTYDPKSPAIVAILAHIGVTIATAKEIDRRPGANPVGVAIVGYAGYVHNNDPDVIKARAKCKAAEAAYNTAYAKRSRVARPLEEARTNVTRASRELEYARQEQARPKLVTAPDATKQAEEEARRSARQRVETLLDALKANQLPEFLRDVATSAQEKAS